MTISTYNLFHKRQQNASATFKYFITHEFKVQFLMIINNMLSRNKYRNRDLIFILHNLRYAFGVFSLDSLSGEITPDPFQEIQQFILKTNDSRVISAIEYICSYYINMRYLISCINNAFKYNKIGYKFVCEGDGFIAKIEDDTFYDEITSKSLGVLSSKKYIDAQNYFISSYKKLAATNYDDALVDICRAIETLLKTRFTEIGIPYQEKDTLKPLLDIAQKHILASHNFHAFKELILDAGRARNAMGGHGVTPGQSPRPDEVYVRFVINQAAANLLFLAEVEMKP